MKHFILITTALIMFAGTAVAQCPPRSTPQSSTSSSRDPEAPPICLESFEMCNNWARHYCYAGSHERKVNEILRQMKERGVTITTAIIKSVAKRTLKHH